ncbi:thioredoxin [Peptoniphilus sp. MSJ-1]|uniref:Thioredoxin n=1 Tax=Peptoniphilus ovalis TaxID=2841503 RepID=A0ABS6FEE8_9FIRM|nr:thioredoxin domain-containing protein [Peptoniphilus ovalis]MBU5668344.1 thioredoxin [Peptoniphilus ovalis]
MRVYPRGTVVYNKDKAYNGINVISTAKDGALVTKMDGTELKRFSVNPMPAKMLVNKNFMSISSFRSSDFGVSDGISLLEFDKDGDVKKSFNKHTFFEDRGYRPKWMARAHSDFQREGNSVGYYYPGEKIVENPNTLLLVHDEIVDERISDKTILDDVILEIDYEGNVIWKFSFSEHFDELGFSEAAKNVIYRNPNLRMTEKPVGNYLDVTSISTIGENKWYDQGDPRFHPDNILFTARAANIIGIIDKKRNRICYKLGPMFSDFEKLDPVVGSTFASIIPKGLEGEGNLLIFDNGGRCGYGSPTLTSPSGLLPYVRHYSRILEINPVTLGVKWSVDPRDFGFSIPINGYKFYSPYGGNLQRLPNGNTIITLATEGLVIEITRDKEIVWQWTCPYRTNTENVLKNNMIYRVYRYPYEYLGVDDFENDIEEIKDASYFKLKGAGDFKSVEVTNVADAELSNDIDPLSQESESVKDLEENKKVIRRNQSRIKNISGSHFKETIKELSNAIVVFGAERCSHCDQLIEVIEILLEEEFREVNCFYMDLDKNKDFADKYEIYQLPQVSLYKDGEKVFEFKGEKSYDEIAVMIEDYIL